MEFVFPLFMIGLIILMRVLASVDDVKEPEIWPAFDQNEQFPEPIDLDKRIQNDKWRIAYSPDNSVTSDVIEKFLLNHADRFQGKYCTGLTKKQ